MWRTIRLISPGVLLVATIRRDGALRVSPVEPLVFDGDLWLSMMWQSHKATDLLRDDRILLHSIITTPDGSEGETKVRGGAVPIDDLGTRARYCDAVAVLGWRPREPYFHLFRVEIADVTHIRYAPVGRPVRGAVAPRLRVRAQSDFTDERRGRTTNPRPASPPVAPSLTATMTRQRPIWRSAALDAHRTHAQNVAYLRSNPHTDRQ